MLKSPKTNRLAEGLVEIKTLNMLDETAPKAVHKEEDDHRYRDRILLN